MTLEKFSGRSFLLWSTNGEVTKLTALLLLVMICRLLVGTKFSLCLQGLETVRIGDAARIIVVGFENALSLPTLAIFHPLSILLVVCEGTRNVLQEVGACMCVWL